MSCSPCCLLNCRGRPSQAGPFHVHAYCQVLHRVCVLAGHVQSPFRRFSGWSTAYAISTGCRSSSPGGCVGLSGQCVLHVIVLFARWSCKFADVCTSFVQQIDKGSVRYSIHCVWKVTFRRKHGASSAFAALCRSSAPGPACRLLCFVHMALDK